MSSENGGFNSSKPASEVMSEFEGVSLPASVHSLRTLR